VEFGGGRVGHVELGAPGESLGDEPLRVLPRVGGARASLVVHGVDADPERRGADEVELAREGDVALVVADEPGHRPSSGQEDGRAWRAQCGGHDEDGS
jgi:hypothetical protein